MNIPEEDLAYMAGFFDGEGCISIYKLGNNPNHIEVGITQTVEEPLLLYAKYFKGSIQKKKKTKGELNLFVFRTSSKANVTALLSALYPYLIVKKAKAQLAFKLLDKNIPEEKEFLKIPYMAGFFDAEGSISVRVYSGNKLHPIVRVGQTHITPLLFFKEIFGGWFRHAPTIKGLDAYHFAVKTSSLEKFARLLSHYLLVKRVHLELLMKMQSIKLNNNSKDEHIVEKWQLTKDIIDLNSKKGNKESSKVLHFFKKAI